jgi:hypothetical protein
MVVGAVRGVGWRLEEGDGGIGEFACRHVAALVAGGVTQGFVVGEVG